MLGYKGEAHWLDISDYVIHLTKDGPEGRTAYGNMMSLLSDGRLEPGPKPFGCGRRIAAIADSQRAVCFSEIPLGFLQRLVDRRECTQGIGFKKSFARTRGAAPIWYVDHGSVQHVALNALMARAQKSPVVPEDPIWRLTPFVDIVGERPVAPYDYDFQWEREWRVVGDFNFEPEDVAFLLLPADLHGAARGFFEDVYSDNRGPAYFCPYIDPRWTVEEVTTALSTETHRPVPR